MADDLFTYESPPQKSTRAMAEEGMQAAVEHADRVEFAWSDRALAMVQRYAVTHHRFMAEEVRVWSTSKGLPTPPTNRAWGAVMVQARRMEIVVSDGAGLTSVPPAHATYATIWKSLIFKGPAAPAAH